MLILGLPVAMFTWYVSGYLLGQVLGRTIRVPVPDLLSGGAVDNDQPQTPAKASTVVGIMLIPMLLIFMNTGLSTLISEKVVSTDEHWVLVARMIGSTPVALLISVLVALYVLGSKRGVKAIKNYLEKPHEFGGFWLPRQLCNFCNVPVSCQAPVNLWAV